MRVKLKFLEYGTEFTFEGKRYRLAPTHWDGKISCQPFLGGKFQAGGELVVWIGANTEVEVN